MDIWLGLLVSVIDRVNSHQHLGVVLKSNLDWSKQIHETCIKANQELSVLRSDKILKRKTLDLLYKLVVRSVIDYALPLYGKTLKQTELARLEQLQLTQLDFENTKNLRSKGGYMPYSNYGNTFVNSFFTFISKLWNNLPRKNQSMTLLDFKAQLKIDIKPERRKHYQIGPKDSNSLLTRFRTGRTNLNLNRYTIGQSDDPSCMCHFRQESSEHFILDCFVFTVELLTAFFLLLSAPVTFLPEGVIIGVRNFAWGFKSHKQISSLPIGYGQEGGLPELHTMWAR